MLPSRDIARLIEIMAALRTPGTGCPWGLQQDFQSLAPYAIEEAYEVADAISRNDMADLAEELGDLLLQVVFHAQLAREQAAFDFGDVVMAITAKMVRRHPHVFGPLSGLDIGRAADNWQAIKAQERKAKEMARSLPAPSLLADVPVALPGLTRAIKLQEKASSVGFDWDDARLVLDKIREETLETTQALELYRAEGTAPAKAALSGEIGDMLFAIANLARHVGIDPEASVRQTNAKFERRFAFIEAELAADGLHPQQSNLTRMEQLWNAAKLSE